MWGLSVAFVLLSVSPSGGAEKNQIWPQFRGPQANGTAPAADLPRTWTRDENVRWKIANPGEGWSTPVIWDRHLFLTAAGAIRDAENGPELDAQPRPYQGGGGTRREDLLKATYEWKVYCYDALTGEAKWDRVVRRGTPPFPRHSSNTYATESPVTDGQRVYAYFGMAGVYCLDYAGQLLWQRDLGTFEMRAGWGTSSSPTLHGNKLFLQVDNEQQSFVVALDARTGDERWRVARDENSQYSSPVIWQNSQRTELVLGGQVARSYDPETGRLLWQLDMEKGRSSASPVADGDMLYIGTELRNRGEDDDGGGFLFAVRAGAAGTIDLQEGTGNSPHIAWCIARSGIEMASPVVCAGHLYLLERRNGILHCLQAATGTSVYRKRIPGARAFWASPLVVGDNVYCFDSDGATHVVRGGAEFAVAARNALDEMCWSTPAVAHDALYLRTVEHLYCFGAPQSAKPGVH